MSNSELLACLNVGLREAFEIDLLEPARNSSARPKNRTNYAGIVKLKTTEEYYDKKIFSEESVTKNCPLLFCLYDFASEDRREQHVLSNAFLFDENSKIRLRAGIVDTLLPLIFLQELSKTLKQGLLKTYVLKEENLSFAKGKINSKGQLQNELNRRPKIASIYWDLTTNAFLNHVILRAATILVNKQKLGVLVRSKLAFYASQMRQEFVEDVDILPSDFLKHRQIPKRYAALVKLSESVIRMHYHSVKPEEEVECPSFMINLATVWESFLRAAIRHKFTEWTVEKTDINLEIFDEEIEGTPDIILKKENRLILLDAKYKEKPSSSDFYQLCAYLGSKYGEYKDNLRGFLLYTGIDSERNDPSWFYPLTKFESCPKIALRPLYLGKYLGADFKAERFCEELYNLIMEN